MMVPLACRSTYFFRYLFTEALRAFFIKNSLLKTYSDGAIGIPFDILF
jgi:hypothetical protein